MAPGAGSTARRGDARALRRAAPETPVRPSLRLFEPTVRRRSRRRTGRLPRPELWVASLLVVGSLLGVVVGDAVVADGQIRLSDTQQAITAATTTEKAEQVAVADLAAPPVVVRKAEGFGLVAPASVVEVPAVPLDVPLPVPQTSATAGRPPA